MLVRSAFLGSKKAWFVHVDVASTSTCSTNNEPGPAEMVLRSENGGQLQKSHLPLLDAKTSNLPDGQAIQTHSPPVNGSSPEKHLLQPDSNTILVNNFQKAVSGDPLANVPSRPDDSSLPQVGSSSVENPTVISSHQDGGASKVSNPVARDLISELGSSLDVVKGLDHEVLKDSDLVNVGNEVSEMHNPSKDDVMVDQRENSVMDEEARVNIHQDRPQLSDIYKSSVRDKEIRVSNDKTKPQLTENHMSEKRSVDLQLEDNSTENLQVAAKKRRRRKEKDAIVDPVEKPSEDVIAGVGLAEVSKSIPQTDEPDKLSSLNASHEDIVKGLDHEVPKDSHLVNVGNEILEVLNPSKDDVMIDQIENSVRDEETRVNNDQDRAQLTDNYNLSVRDKESGVCNDQDRPQLTDNYKSEKSSGDLQLEDNSGENLQVSVKKRRKRKEKDAIVELVEKPSEDIIVAGLAKCGKSISQTDEPDKLSSLNASHEGIVKGSDHKVPKDSDNGGNEILEMINPSKDDVMIDQRENSVRYEETRVSNDQDRPQLTDNYDTSVREKETRVSNDQERPQLTDNHKSEKNSGDLKLEDNSRENLQVAVKKRRKRKEKDAIVEPFEKPSEHGIVGSGLAEGSKNIPQTDEADKLSSLNASYESNRSMEAVDGVASEPLVGAIDVSKPDGSGLETEGDDAAAQPVVLEDKIAKMSRKRRAARLNPPIIEEHEKATGDISPAIYENAIPGDDGVGIHQHAEIRNGDNAVPMIKEPKIMAPESKSCEDGVDSSKLSGTTEAAEIVDFGGKKGSRPKKSRATSAKNRASHSSVECLNVMVALPSQKSNLHGLDDKYDKNFNSEQHGIDENAFSQTKKKESFKTSQADNVGGNEVSPPELDPMSRTEDTADFKDEKGKRKSKKTRSNAKSVPEPSMELLQDGAHKTSGDGENLDIHQTDENKKEEALPAKSENKKEDTASPRKRKKPKSDKKSSKNQFAGSMLEVEDMGVKTKSSDPVKAPGLESSVDGSQGEANSQGIQFKEFFVPRGGESGDTAKELAATRKPHERTRKRARKSNAEDRSLDLKKLLDGNPDTVDLHGSSSKDEDKHAYHHDNGTSVVTGDVRETQPDHQRDNYLAGMNGSKPIKSNIDDTSAAHGSSKVTLKTSQKKNKASEAASSASATCAEEPIYISKLGKKSRSSQYYVAVNRVADKKLGEVFNNSDREKSSMATLESVFKHVSGESFEGEGEKIDSDATTNISTDHSSSPSYSDGEETRFTLKTPASRNKAHMESPGTGIPISILLGIYFIKNCAILVCVHMRLLSSFATDLVHGCLYALVPPSFVAFFIGRSQSLFVKTFSKKG